MPESLDGFEMNLFPREELRTVAIGGKAIQLFVPDEQRIRDVWSLKEGDQRETFPYWSRIWPSALALCDWLSRHPSVYTGKKVVELGAGLGLPSLFVAPGAESVLVSDKDPEAMAYLRASMNHHRYLHIVCAQINWQDGEPPVSCDLLLLSDVNYEPAGFQSLQGLMQVYLDQGTEIVLATPHRLSAREFVAWMEPFIRSSDLVEAEGQAISVYLLSG